MPARDNRGPLGEGPMTGRALGNCSGNATTTSRGFFGSRRGGFLGRSRFGRGNGYGVGVQNYSDTDEISSMRERIAQLEEIIKNK
jgi:hypothetical protein